LKTGGVMGNGPLFSKGTTVKGPPPPCWVCKCVGVCVCERESVRVRVWEGERDDGEGGYRSEHASVHEYTHTQMHTHIHTRTHTHIHTLTESATAKYLGLALM
jgi:hypothetical protein